MKGLLAGAIAIVILALVVPRPDEPSQPREPVKPARASALSSSGSFSHANSRAGMPIFTASNVGPGTLVEGSVTIANSGSSNGYFSLSQADLVDAPGPNGGALSAKLALEIRDVTDPAKPVGVYSGPFGGMGLRQLGFIEPGSKRNYRFTATIPDSGGPATPISGDNALKGSSASARFVWSAVEGSPPKGPGKPALPARDRRPPRLTVSIARVQRLLTRPYIDTKARCSERCTLTVSGRARAGGSSAFAVRRLRRKLRAGKPVRVRVRLSRSAMRSVRRRLLAGGRVTVRLKYTALDSERNRSVVKRTLRLLPRPQ